MHSFSGNKESFKGGGEGGLSWPKKKTKPSYNIPKMKSRNNKVCGSLFARSVVFVLVLLGLAMTCYGRPESRGSIENGYLLGSHRAAREVGGIVDLAASTEGE